MIFFSYVHSFSLIGKYRIFEYVFKSLLLHLKVSHTGPRLASQLAAMEQHHRVQTHVKLKDLVSEKLSKLQHMNVKTAF